MKDSKKAQAIVESAMDANDCFMCVEEDALSQEEIDKQQDTAFEVLKVRIKDPVGLRAIAKYEAAEIHDDRCRRRIIKVSIKGRGKTIKIAQLAEKLIGIFRYRKAEEPPEAA